VHLWALTSLEFIGVGIRIKSLILLLVVLQMIGTALTDVEMAIVNAAE